MKTTLTRISVFVLFFAVGFGIVVQTSSQFHVARDPAAIRQVYDFTHLRGGALDGAMKQRLVAGIEIFKSEDSFGLGFGHFAFLNESGERTLGCREYAKMILTFEAEGVVVNGEKPVMEVEGACEYSEDLAKINPLQVPVAKILGERPADGEFQYREGREVAVRFTNISDEWPRKWVLVGMKMKGATREMAVDRNDIGRVLGHPLMISIE